MDYFCYFDLVDNDIVDDTVISHPQSIQWWVIGKDEPFNICTRTTLEWAVREHLNSALDAVLGYFIQGIKLG